MLRQPEPAPGVVVDEIGDELCLMRMDTSEVLVLNRTASDVWLLATQGLPATELIARLAAAYDVEVAEVEPQILDVLHDLELRGFLIEAP